MEISKENMFKTQYTTYLGQAINKKWTSKIWNFIKNNKIISITITIFLMCLSINIALICNFIKILESYM